MPLSPSSSTTTLATILPPPPGASAAQTRHTLTTWLFSAVVSTPGWLQGGGQWPATGKPPGALGSAEATAACLAFSAEKLPRTILRMYSHVDCTEPPGAGDAILCFACLQLWLMLPYDFKESVFLHEGKKGKMSYSHLKPSATS